MSGHVARKRETEATRHGTGGHVAKETRTLTVDANVNKKREYRHSTPGYYTRKIIQNCYIIQARREKDRVETLSPKLLHTQDHIKRPHNQSRQG